jgi:iron-sulfur cluster repair protein YtfE (RIC family)
MLRDKSLVPLSRQHQHALALCVRIDRARPVPEEDLPAWQAEIEQHFAQEVGIHFSAEESVVFPAARRFPELIPLVEELLADHASLRELFSEAKARRMSAERLADFVLQLSSHIRKEERQLFESLQQLMMAEEMAVLGKLLEKGLEDAAQSCVLQNETIKRHP